MARELDESLYAGMQMTALGAMAQAVIIDAGAPAHAEPQWLQANWKRIGTEVKRLQVRIAKATLEGRWGKVKVLQHLLTRSHSGKMLAVKRVTENRPNMRFVPSKNIEQQSILSVHRVRKGFVKARTAQANQIRGLLGEFGLVIPQGIYNVAKQVPELLEDASNELPVPFRQLIDRLTEHLKELDRQVKDLEKQIIAWHRSNELSRKLEKIPGIGPLAASALVASIADARSFENGRQVSAWLGLVPRQNSSGGKATLLGMSKRGDAYLRTLLIHGAGSAIITAKNKVDNTDGWLANLLNRRHPNIAAVALANKDVRTMWAILAHGREFRPDYATARMAA
jgi:transposase